MIRLYYPFPFFSANAARSPELDFLPSADLPALQYLERVDPGSMADKAGLKEGDFILEVSVDPGLFISDKLYDGQGRGFF